jgi:hypothetical protein
LFAVMQNSNQYVLVSRRKLLMRLIHRGLIPMGILNLIKVIVSTPLFGNKFL